MSRQSHVGVNLLDAERDAILQRFDIAIKKGYQDAAKTKHGLAAEDAFRVFLQNFLPKKFGVTKGYILTPDLNYDSNLEEFDVIIYDAIESPVLSIEINDGQTQDTGNKAIPIRYVLAVIEIKAKFNKALARKAVEQLLKLSRFGINSNPLENQNYSFSPRLLKSAVFFETGVTTPRQFSSALGELAPLLTQQDDISHAGSLIIRAHNRSSCSAIIDYSDLPQPGSSFPEWWEASDQFTYFRDGPEKPGFPVAIASYGFSENEFWRYMMGLYMMLTGNIGPRKRFETRIYDYGFKHDKHTLFPLFPRQETPLPKRRRAAR